MSLDIPANHFKQTDRIAKIIYLGHSGWAVVTRECILIFDYWEAGKNPASRSISKGFINAEELSDQKVFVFVSHDHKDHFDRVIFKWLYKIKDIKYVMGWPYSNAEKYISFKPRETKKIDEMEITTIESTDAGVGFLIKVDGLTIFHAGDHENGSGYWRKYKKEIDFLAQVTKQIDFAFLPVCRYERDWEDSNKGSFYFIERLKPSVVFPMHAGGEEHFYQKFAKEAKKKMGQANVRCAAYRGEYFFFKNGEITR